MLKNVISYQLKFYFCARKDSISENFGPINSGTQGYEQIDFTSCLFFIIASVIKPGFNISIGCKLRPGKILNIKISFL
jgi:hypothetical protein